MVHVRAGGCRPARHRTGAARPPGTLDAQAQALLQPLVEKAALVQSINEAWALVAVLTIAALAFVPIARKVAVGDLVRA